MRFGLITPVVTRHPANDAPWTEAAGPEAIGAIAEAADRLGFAHLTCSEHVVIPTAVGPVRGTRYYDPLATLAWIAARTTRVRLVTHVLVLGYHHPLTIAKRYGTLDRLSGGRLVLGVGVGTLGEEFGLLNVPFDDRGPRYEDALRALRATFGAPTPSYAGSYYTFDDVVIDPCGVQCPVPIWLGGRTRRSLRRAIELGDGWNPFGLAVEQLGDMLDWARSGDAWAAREAPFDLVLPIDQPFDPIRPAERRRLVERLERFQALGTTIVNLRFTHTSLDHYLDQLAVVADEVVPRFA